MTYPLIILSQAEQVEKGVARVQEIRQLLPNLALFDLSVAGIWQTFSLIWRLFSRTAVQRL